MRIFLLVFLLGLSANITAEPEVRLSSHAADFDYREFATDGRELNTEKGWLFGYRFSFTAGIKNWRAGVFAEQLQNTVDYEGATQIGVPLSTQTFNRINALGLLFSWQFIPSIKLETSYAINRRDRHIFATSFSSELRETYRWPSLEAGLAYRFTVSPKVHARLGLGYLQAFDGSLLVDLRKQGFGEPLLDLKGGRGYYAYLGAQYTINKNWSLLASAKLKQWETARGDASNADNGSVRISIREPASRYRLLDLGLLLRRSF